MKYRWQPHDCDLPRWLVTLLKSCFPLHILFMFWALS
jgi:hypothetical protein